jgi:cytoskeleton protein RodZ
VVGFIGALGPGTAPEVAGNDELTESPPPSMDENEDEGGSDTGNEDAEAEPEDEAESEAETDEAEEEPEADEPDGVELLLEFEDRSWTRVEVDGTLVLEETVEAGEILPFEGDEEIVVRFGNAGGVRAQLNGEDLGAQGGRGDVVNVVFTRDGAESA